MNDEARPCGGRQAAALAPHAGRWVALAAADPTEVLVAADTPQKVVRWLSAHRECPAYGMFRVPEPGEGVDPATPHARVADTAAAVSAEPAPRTFEQALHLLAPMFWDDRQLAVDLYAALCGQPWEHPASGEDFSTSWRGAGDIAASVRGQGEDYLQYYGSGDEGRVSERIADLLAGYGWYPVADKEAWYQAEIEKRRYR